MKKWLLLFLASFPPISDAALISFNPENFNVAPGDILKAPIFIAGLSSSVVVGAYDLSVQFDPSRLVYEQFIFSNFLGNAGTQAFSGAILLPGGRVEATLISLLSPAQLDDLQGSAFELGEIWLTATSSSQSTLSISGTVGDGFGNPIESRFQEALVNGATPEPGTLRPCASAFAGLAILVLWRRRQRV